MRFLLVLLTCVGTLNALHAQYTTEFRTGTSDIVFNAVQVMGTDILVAGNDDNKVLFVRYDIAGNVIDSRTITVVDETILPYVCSMIVDSDGKIVFAGHRKTATEDETTAFIGKYDYTTNTVSWIKVLENPGSSFYKVIEKKAGSTYIVAGQTLDPVNNEEAVLFSVNRNTGNLTKLNNYNETTGGDTYYSIVRAGNSYFTSGRFTYAPGGSSRMRGCLSKFNNAGAEVFTKAYLRNLTTENGRMHAVDLAYANNELYMTIHGDETGVVLNEDLFIVNAETDGELNWANQYDFTNYDKSGSFRSIKVKGSSVYAMGNLYNLGTGYLFLLKLDTVGNIIWSYSYSSLGNKSNSPDAMLLYGSNIFMTGYVHDAGTVYTNGTLLMVKTATGTLPDDCSTSEPLIVTPKTTTAYANAITSVAHTYTVSTGASALGEPDAFTSAFTCALGLRESVQNNTLSLQPNPTNGLTQLQLDARSYTIQIFNMSGQCIYTQQTSERTLAIDASAFNSGLYLIHCTDKDSGKVQYVQLVKQ